MGRPINECIVNEDVALDTTDLWSDATRRIRLIRVLDASRIARLHERIEAKGRAGGRWGRWGAIFHLGLLFAFRLATLAFEDHFHAVHLPGGHRGLDGL